MTKVLITGIAGHLGSKLADWIIENKPDVKVIGVDNLSGGYKENINPKVIFRIADVKSKDFSKLMRKYQPEYIFHFSAYAAEGLSPFIRKFNYNENLIATANVVNNCIKYNVKRLVFTSSMAVYGHGVNEFLNEDDPTIPIDPYGVAKLASELDIKIAGEQHGLDWCIIRPHNVYGEKQNIWDVYRNVIGIWMVQHLNNEPMTIYGDGQQTRSFTYIDNILEPLWKAATDERASKQIINLGDPKAFTIQDINDKLCSIIGGGKTIYKEGRFEAKHSMPTVEKSIKLLDYKYEIGMYGGMKRMWEWAKHQPLRERKVWDLYELDKGLYTYWNNKK